MITVVTGRFNTETLNSNYEYRKKYGFNCLYCCPLELSPKILYDTPVFVIEMNNSTNKIEGVGLIKNRIQTNRYYKVHNDGNTNRYIYIGNYFIDRETLESYNPQLVYILEIVLFKGKTHSKRGSGLTIIPEKVLKFDICKGINLQKDIKTIFIYQFRTKISQDNGVNIIQDNIENRENRENIENRDNNENNENNENRENILSKNEC
jgi:hypothetical protein